MDARDTRERALRGLALRSLSGLSPDAERGELAQIAYDFDAPETRREFERIVRWSRMVPLFRLSYPRHYSLLQDVRTAILAHVGPPQTSRTPGTEPDSAAAPVESECA